MLTSPTRLFAFCLASIALVGPLAVHGYMPMIPAVKVGLGIPDALAQLSFSVALFGMAAATLVYGTLSDRFGRRPVLLSGLALFLAGSLLSLFATSIVPLVLGRLLQAIGAGCGMTLVRTIARDAYGPEQLVKVLAYLTMFYTIGPMIAPVMSGFLVDNFGWRSGFLFAFAAGAAITAGAYFVLYETKPEGSGLVAGASIAQSYRALFSHLRFVSYVCQTGFSTGAFMVTAAAASFIMKEMLDRPATEYGLWFMAFPVGYFSGNFVSSRIGSRVRIETMVLAGSILSLLSGGALCILLGLGIVTPWSVFIPGLLITFSQGIALPFGQAGALAVEPKYAGTASGVGVCMQNLCGFLTTQAYGLLADGTVWPLIITCGTSTLIMMGFGVIPWLMARKEA